MTADDLASFSSEWVTPISIDYRGWRISELPPNSQGLAALEMMNIMEVTPASPLGPFSPPEMHKRIEAMKLAYSDVRRYNADPRSADIPVDRLISKDYAKKARGADRSAKGQLRRSQRRSRRQQHYLPYGGR